MPALYSCNEMRTINRHDKTSQKHIQDFIVHPERGVASWIKLAAGLVV
jgi:hypothetical protein